MVSENYISPTESVKTPEIVEIKLHFYKRNQF